MVRLYALIERLAKSDLPVLIVGERHGKELAASALHHGSPRAAARMSASTAGRCRSLAESELFGHERGASPAPCKQARFAGAPAAHRLFRRAG